jgi:hypothetical protein
VNRPLGTLLIVGGAALAGFGILVLAGGASWFGHLPGDIRIERGSVRFYLPLTSMLLISVVLTLVLNFLRRLF